ncbi:MAG: molybdopterin molybdotransferase MoeA [Desulfovibrio sp.]|nr:molybdopterin molybdotransferase MoeA [Desulfovibrio sp.]
MTSFLTLTPVPELLAHIASFAPLEAEDVPLEEGAGRTLAEDFRSPEELPGFDRSVVDGFAVRARDVFGAGEGMPALLSCLGEIPMGAVPTITVMPGTCVRIWTGGMLPQGADAVVMLEYVRQVADPDSADVELTRPVAPGDNVLAKDEDCGLGETLIPGGRLLRPQEVGLLAGLGQERVRVRRRPKVAVISTGDEVIPYGRRPLPGQVRDVNAVTLAALAREEGGEARFFGLVGDDEATLKRLVGEAFAWGDVVLVSGGSSAGRRDYTLNALAAVPGCSTLIHGVAVSPGKPLIFARSGEKSCWGMPGHVASALVCAHVFLRPLLRRLLGRDDGNRIEHVVSARMTRPVPSVLGRRDYIRVALGRPLEPGDAPTAIPVLGKSGAISTLVKADGLVVCLETDEGIPAGTLVEVEPLR